jgi:hemolysin III
MGWLVVVAGGPLLENVPANGLYYLLAGGVAYSLGTVFYLWEKLPFHHAIWHLFVLSGSVCHFFAVLLYVLPVRA